MAYSGGFSVDGVPIIGWLVSNNGGGWVVLGRVIGFHVAEAACCFMLAKSTENPEKRIIGDAAGTGALLEMQRFEHTFAAFDQVKQQLDGPVQVQALPAAGQTSEAASASSKKGGSKAITAEFQTLDASQSGEMEGSSNGYRSFRHQR